MSPTTWMPALRQRWTRLAPREQALSGLAAALVGLALLWTLALAPAWRTLREAPALQQALLAQYAQMQALAARATALRDAPALAGLPPATGGTTLDEATLSTLTGLLGEGAKVEVTGRRAVMSFSSCPAAQLRMALTIARARAQAELVEAQLKPVEQGISGKVVLELGARS